jgi:hypothetical protein
MKSDFTVKWLRRTAIASYSVGVYAFISAAAVYVMASSIASAIVYGGMTFQQAVEPMIPLLTIVDAVGTATWLIFALGLMKIGQSHGSSLVQLTGFLLMISPILTVALAPLSLSSTTLSIVGGTVVQTVDPFAAAVNSLKDLVTLVAYIMLVVSAFIMNGKSGIGAYNVAGFVVIIGLFVGFVVPIGIIILGIALSLDASKRKAELTPHLNEADEDKKNQLQGRGMMKL